ncbi:MAG: hypothetical protein E7510_10435 [Ruminococcus sp.]|nr:hypothetical protein [Ruminococcus sp.]
MYIYDFARCIEKVTEMVEMGKDADEIRDYFFDEVYESIRVNHDVSDEECDDIYSDICDYIDEIA